MATRKKKQKKRDAAKISRENVSWGCIGRAAFPDLAEAGNHGTPEQSKQRRRYENDVENELGVQLANTLRAAVTNGISVLKQTAFQRLMDEGATAP
jgi:hypothetical protein